MVGRARLCRIRRCNVDGETARMESAAGRAPPKPRAAGVIAAERQRQQSF